MEKHVSSHVEEAMSENAEMNKTVATGLHVERKLLDGDDIVLIPTPSDDPRGK